MESTVRFALSGLLALALAAASACSSNDSSARTDAGTQAGTRPSGDAARPAPAASRPRVVFLGDSLTAGMGLPTSQAFPSLLEERLRREGYDVEVVNAGVSGDTSAGGRRRLNWAFEGNVRILVLALGANDGLRGMPVANMKSNLQAIVREAKGRGVKVLLLGMEAPPNFGAEYTAQFRSAFRDLAREEDIEFVPFFLEGIAGVPELNQGDGLHPNAQGAARIADIVWKALEPMVEKELKQSSQPSR